MLPLPWGIIELAQKSGCPIVPIVIEFDGRNCYANFGGCISVKQNDNKAEKIVYVRDSMATLRWEIWEKYFQTNRADISPGEWEKEGAARVAAYPPLDFEHEKSYIRKEKNVIEYSEAFAQLETLTPNKQSAFF